MLSTLGRGSSLLDASNIKMLSCFGLSQRLMKTLTYKTSWLLRWGFVPVVGSLSIQRLVPSIKTSIAEDKSLSDGCYQCF